MIEVKTWFSPVEAAIGIRKFKVKLKNGYRKFRLLRELRFSFSPPAI